MAEEQKPLELLVIDDDEVIRHLFEEVAKIVGANVTTAVDGQEGIAMYEERYGTATPYDAVITDLNMPKATGVDVTRRVKELSPKTPVYVVTGVEANAEYRRLSAELGELKPDGVLQKPFGLQDLRDVLGQIKSQISGTENQPYQPPTPNQS